MIWPLWKIKSAPTVFMNQMVEVYTAAAVAPPLDPLANFFFILCISFFQFAQQHRIKSINTNQNQNQNDLNMSYLFV